MTIISHNQEKHNQVVEQLRSDGYKLSVATLANRDNETRRVLMVGKAATTDNTYYQYSNTEGQVHHD